MSLTLIYRGKNVSFKMRMLKAQWLSIAAILILLTVWLIRGAIGQTDDTNHVREQLSVAQKEYREKSIHHIVSQLNLSLEPQFEKLSG